MRTSNALQNQLSENMRCKRRETEDRNVPENSLIKSLGCLGVFSQVRRRLLCGTVAT